MTSIRIDGYVIASADGMLADATGEMPDTLKFSADQTFFNAAMDKVDLIVHGRHSFEDQPNSPHRRRIVLTRAVDTLSPSPDNPKATLWNPSGARFADALAYLNFTSGTIAVIGGPEVYAMFFDRFDTFWLSQAANVLVPDGRGCFPGVPQQTPQQVLASHGLTPGATQVLDADADVHVTAWDRIT